MNSVKKIEITNALKKAGFIKARPTKGIVTSDATYGFEVVNMTVGKPSFIVDHSPGRLKSDKPQGFEMTKAYRAVLEKQGFVCCDYANTAFEVIGRN